MDPPSSPEFDIFIEDNGFESELDFELDADSSVGMDDSSSTRVDESPQDSFFDIDSDFDLLDEMELFPPSENPFKMDLDLEEAQSSSHSDGSDSEMSVDSENSSSVIRSIEDMVLSFLTQLAHPGGARARVDDDDSDSDSCPSPASKTLPKIELELVNRSKSGSGRISLLNWSSPAMKVLRYPKKTKTGSLKPFAQLFRVLDLAHEASLSGVPTTKRDIYYKDVALFKSQKVVDTLVDDLASTFGLDRSDLNIGTLIPAGEDIEAFSVDEDVAWVLIVEKEAVFQTLCRLKICRSESMPGAGILITVSIIRATCGLEMNVYFQGKGYPDVATRHIVKSLADALPKSVPILALVDADPFGLDILSVYKYGSRAMQHENDKLAARRIKWLGLWASELGRFGIAKDDLLQITKHDEKKALAMLRRENVPTPARWKKEMQYMLHSRRKAEIEVLYTQSKSSDSGTGAIGSSQKVLQNETSRLTAFEDSSDLHIFSSSPQLRDSDMKITWPSPNYGKATESHCKPHALLMRYLEEKVTGFIGTAMRRTKS
ncbi:hypothetical protein M413DRAFT_24646 [Hebeloma cylindrosporum]|uniref:DNA topoisomerase (ATP-hydrolyzing) n=1 Tax=Hebeloma cylindrosporum TaxID=76867 RepID=A0A0C3C9C6_HEBCY|nr:hypothetical protein M413DRAFT_24646 [Hebeloma cylindrosporum h7]